MEINDKAYADMCKSIKDKSDNEKFIGQVLENLAKMIQDQANKIWDLEHEVKELKDKVLYYESRYKDKDGAE